jgi:hypothetical protein
MLCFGLPMFTRDGRALAFLAMWAVGGCTCAPRELFPSQDGAMADSGDAGPDAERDAGPTCPTLGAHCGGRPCACENCLDDDGDLAADVGSDPECTGYLDDDESSFQTGLTGDNKDCRQDCFFDGNSGGGGTDCQIPLACLVDIADYNTREGANCSGTAPNPPNDCVIGNSCIADCMPFVPSGCDCFGCCDVVGADALTYHVLVGSPCTRASLSGGEYGDCYECTPSTTCHGACATPCTAAPGACGDAAICVSGCCVADSGL